MSTSALASNKYKANSQALNIHIGTTLTCVLMHTRGVSSSIEGTIKYSNLVSTAIVASMVRVQNRACDVANTYTVNTISLSQDNGYHPIFHITKL